MTTRITICLSLALLFITGCASMNPRKLAWNKSDSKSEKSDNAKSSSKSKNAVAAGKKSKTGKEKEESSVASANYGDRKQKSSSAVSSSLEKAMQADNKAAAAEERAQAAEKKATAAEQKQLASDAARFHEEAQAANDEAKKGFQEARLAYEKVLKQDAENPTALHRLAIIADKQERYTDAERLYQQVLKLKPNDPSILSDLGYSYTLQNRPDQAEKTFRDILKTNPDHRFAQGNLGHLLAKRAQATGNRKDYDEAFDCFRKAGGYQMAQSEMEQLFPNGPPRNLAQNQNNNEANPFMDNAGPDNAAPDRQNPAGQRNLAANQGQQPQGQQQRNQPAPKTGNQQVVWGELRDQFSKIDNPPAEAQRTVSIPTGMQPAAPQAPLTQTAAVQNAPIQMGGTQNAQQGFQNQMGRQPEFQSGNPQQPPRRQEEVPWDAIVSNAPQGRAPANPSNQNPNAEPSRNQSLANLNMAPQVDNRQPTTSMAPIQSHVGLAADPTQQQPWTMTPAQGNVPTSTNWDDAQREAAQLSMSTMFPMSDPSGRNLPQTGFPNSGSPAINQGSAMFHSPGGAPQINQLAPVQPTAPRLGGNDAYQTVPMTNATGGQYGNVSGQNPNIVNYRNLAPPQDQRAAEPRATMTGIEQFEAELQQAPQGSNNIQLQGYQPIPGQQPMIRPATAVYPQ